MKLSTVLILILFLKFSIANGANPTTKHYIVYMGEHSHPNSDSVVSANHEMLASVIGSIDGAQKAAIHHYSKSFRGLSAMLTAKQAQELAERVWPESESFKDEGLGPVPERFKGECVTGDQFPLGNCNRKIIGARYYYKGFEAEKGTLKSFNKTFFQSARDSEGHGTYTASIVAGSAVTNVSLLGLARGTARGGAPSTRLAIYKACWFSDCSEADILAALDDATSDGVDIISLSLGPLKPNYFSSGISIGTFHAFKKGVFVSAAAGNFGLPSTATNIMPWVITVAASSIDREFESKVQLGKFITLKGQSLNPLKMSKYHKVIDASAAAAPGVPAKNASFCKNNTLDHSMIKGKIVVCNTETYFDDRMHKSIVIKEGGGVGMILIDVLMIGGEYLYVIPSTVIDQNEARELQAYLSKEKNPIAKIHPTKTVLNTKPAPEMAAFSSMGPNIITPEIIKPDIAAPGVNILAAWSPLPSETTAGLSLNYYIGSGTSASCPHVSAIAAIIKSCHPSWSPSAIKSAIMTTARVLDNTRSRITKVPIGSPTTPFDYGSGHAYPIAALDPGLVYDFDSNDIIDFLCSNHASPAESRNLTGKAITCRKSSSTPSYNLNYPSVGVANMNGSLSVRRTVTYHGKGSTVYVAHLENPRGLEVSVTPKNLKFRNAGEKKSYRIHFMPHKSSNGSFVFGAITWSNGIHRVRSPIGLNVVSV